MVVKTEQVDRCSKGLLHSCSEPVPCRYINKIALEVNLEWAGRVIHALKIVGYMLVKNAGSLSCIACKSHLTRERSCEEGRVKLGKSNSPVELFKCLIRSPILLLPPSIPIGLSNPNRMNSSRHPLQSGLGILLRFLAHVGVLERSSGSTSNIPYQKHNRRKFPSCAWLRGRLQAGPYIGVLVLVARRSDLVGETALEHLLAVGLGLFGGVGVGEAVVGEEEVNVGLEGWGWSREREDGAYSALWPPATFPGLDMVGDVVVEVLELRWNGDG